MRAVFEELAGAHREFLTKVPSAEPDPRLLEVLERVLGAPTRSEFERLATRIDELQRIIDGHLAQHAATAASFWAMVRLSEFVVTAEIPQDLAGQLAALQKYSPQSAEELRRLLEVNSPASLSPSPAKSETTLPDQEPPCRGGAE